MPTEAVLAAAAFVGLGLVWVVLPSRIRKKHVSQVEEEIKR